MARTATDDEIKKAYRRKALELHPDRNYGNVDEATRLFAEVQSAYEVLADPQERAWYDSHSDAFLGSDGATDGRPQSYNIRVTTTEDVLKVFSRFSPRMDFSDSSTGFFGGLNEQFARLALEERLACQEEGEDIVDYPSFGSRDDDFDRTVRPFYAAWSGFSTRKSFAWKDAYRYSEAPDRRVRRLMEKENRRLREEGIREFNDAVRSLVAFIKKRDPRYKANAQSEAQRQETLRQSVAAQAARSRAFNQANMREHIIPEWAQSEKPEVDEETESSESEIESFECVACHKHFKSQKQFEAHERSKKHLKAVKQLCREMRVQDKDLGLGPAIDADTPKQPASISLEASGDGADDPASVPSGGQLEASTAAVLSEARAECDEDPKSGSDDSATDVETPHSHPGQGDPIDTIDDDDDYASRESIETRLGSGLGSSREGSITPLTEQLSSSGLDDRTSGPSVGKAKQKRAKKAARIAEQPTGNVCSNCHASFASKTKLFAHIQENPTHAHLKSTGKHR